MKKCIIAFAIFFSLNIFAQGKLYQVCGDKSFSQIASKDCQLKRVSNNKETALLAAIPSLVCNKSQELIIAVTGKGCLINKDFAQFNKVRRLMYTSNYLNSRAFGDIDPERKD